MDETELKTNAFVALMFLAVIATGTYFLFGHMLDAMTGAYMNLPSAFKL